MCQHALYYIDLRCVIFLIRVGRRPPRDVPHPVLHGTGSNLLPPRSSAFSLRLSVESACGCAELLSRLKSVSRQLLPHLTHPPMH